MKTLNEKSQLLQKTDPDLYKEYLRLEQQEQEAQQKRLEEALDSFLNNTPTQNKQWGIYVKGEPHINNSREPLNKIVDDWDDIRRIHVLEAIRDNDIEKLKKLSPFIEFRDASRFGLNNYALYYALKVGSDESVNTLLELGISKELYYCGDEADSVPQALKLALERKSPKVAEVLILSGEKLHLRETTREWMETEPSRDEIVKNIDKKYKKTIEGLSDNALKRFAITLTKQGYPIGIEKEGPKIEIPMANAVEGALKKRGINVKNIEDSPLQFYKKEKNSYRKAPKDEEPTM